MRTINAGMRNDDETDGQEAGSLFGPRADGTGGSAQRHVHRHAWNILIGMALVVRVRWPKALTAASLVGT